MEVSRDEVVDWLVGMAEVRSGWLEEEGTEVDWKVFCVIPQYVSESSCMDPVLVVGGEEHEGRACLLSIVGD